MEFNFFGELGIWEFWIFIDEIDQLENLVRDFLLYIDCLERWTFCKIIVFFYNIYLHKYYTTENANKTSYLSLFVFFCIVPIVF